MMTSIYFLFFILCILFHVRDRVEERARKLRHNKPQVIKKKIWNKQVEIPLTIRLNTKYKLRRIPAMQKHADRGQFVSRLFLFSNHSTGQRVNKCESENTIMK